MMNCYYMNISLFLLNQNDIFKAESIDSENFSTITSVKFIAKIGNSVNMFIYIPYVATQAETYRSFDYHLDIPAKTVTLNLFKT